MEDNDSDEESKEPERMSLIDLKHRGKKKAIVPVNRVQAVLGRKYMHACMLASATIDTLSMVCHLYVAAGHVMPDKNVSSSFALDL